MENLNGKSLFPDKNEKILLNINQAIEKSNVSRMTFYKYMTNFFDDLVKEKAIILKGKRKLIDIEKFAEVVQNKIGKNILAKKIEKKKKLNIVKEEKKKDEKNIIDNFKPIKINKVNINKKYQNIIELNQKIKKGLIPFKNKYYFIQNIEATKIIHIGSSISGIGKTSLLTDIIYYFSIIEPNVFSVYINPFINELDVIKLLTVKHCCYNNFFNVSVRDFYKYIDEIKPVINEISSNIDNNLLIVNDFNMYNSQNNLNSLEVPILNSIFEKIIEKIKNKNIDKPIIFFIDDIDKLQLNKKNFFIFLKKFAVKYNLIFIVTNGKVEKENIKNIFSTFDVVVKIEISENNINDKKDKLYINVKIPKNSLGKKLSEKYLFDKKKVSFRFVKYI